jgi:hypothetical protein
MRGSQATNQGAPPVTHVSDDSTKKQLEDALHALDVATRLACGAAVALACESEEVRMEIEAVLQERIDDHADNPAAVNVFKTVLHAVITRGSVASLLQRPSSH